MSGKSVCNTLCQVYTEDNESCHSLIIKHFPVEWCEKNVHEFLKSVIKTDVNTICKPEAQCDIAVAVLPPTQIVYDTQIQKWQERAFRRPTQKCYPIFELLGVPKGIYIANVPEGISTELLEMYFENVKSGGEEGTVVKPSEEGDIDNSKYVVITINSQKAITSILSKQIHEVNENVLDVTPFYPSVHRYVLETMKNRGERNEAMCQGTTDPQSEDEDKSELQTEPRSEDEDESGVQVEPRFGDEDESVTQAQPRFEDEDENGPQENQRSEVDDKCWLQTEPRFEDVHESEPNSEPQYEDGSGIQADIVKTVSKKIHSEVDIIGHIALTRNHGDNKISDNEISNSLCISTDRHEICLNDDNNQVAPITGRVKPMIRDLTQYDNGPVSEEPQIEMKSLIEESFDIPPYKIELLINFRFKENYETETFKIIYIHEEGKVIFKAHSFEEFKIVRNKLYSCLDEIYIHEIKPDASKYKLLSCKENMSWIRSKCEQKNIKVSFVTDDVRKEVVCYSFDNSHANKGINLVEEFIESLDETKADGANRTVDQYRSKTNFIKRMAHVQLESGKARCFQAQVAEKIRLEIEKLSGSLVVEKMCRDPLKIKVSCTGPEKVVSLLTNAVQAIWHERIDFTKLSTSAEDIGLIKKCLSTQEGTLFLKKFEQKHNCCIEVFYNREKVNSRPRIFVKDVCNASPDDFGTTASSFVVQDHDDKHKHELQHFSRGRNESEKNSKERIIMYQSGMREREAMQKAMELSMQSTSSEVYKDSDSKISFSNGENHASGEKGDTTHNESLMPPSKSCRQSNFKSDYEMSAGTITMSRTTVKLVQGAVAKQKADVLVNVVSNSLTPFDGVIATSFLKIGGQQLTQMYFTNKSGAGKNFVITKSSGRLNCSDVIHVELSRSEHFEKIVKRVVSDVLLQCKKLKAKDIAFPPLGVGKRFGYQPNKVAIAMLSELCSQLAAEDIGVQNVSIVIFDDETFQIFQKEFQDFRTRKPVIHANHVGDGFTRAKGDQCINRRRFSRGREVYETSNNYEDYSSRKTIVRGKHTINIKHGDEHGHSEEDSRHNMSVKLFTNKKDTCIAVRKMFCLKLKTKFLHEETVEKKRSVSASSKNKIVKVITANAIVCMKGKDNYRLKGLKKNVIKAHTEILKILLQDEKNALEQKRKLKSKAKRETMGFVKMMVDDEPETPKYWKFYKEGETLIQSVKRFIGRKCEFVELDKDSRQFKCIVKMVNGTFDSRHVGKGIDARGLGSVGYNSLFILKIERLENLSLYQQYAMRRQTLFRILLESNEPRFPKLEQLPKSTGPIATSKYVQNNLDSDLHPEINEYLLFHSTEKECVPVICNGGFEQRLASGVGMFGQGIYGAEKAMKADQYADNIKNRGRGPLKMFLVRMVLGNIYICKEEKLPYKYRRPPCTNCFRDDCTNVSHSRGKFEHFFDSVCGDNNKLFREFVVYENNLCYPEYLITYERRMR